METLNNWYWSDTILELIIYVSQELYLPILEFCPFTLASKYTFAFRLA